MTNSAPISHPLRVSELAGRKPTRFKLEPVAAERDRIAKDLAIDGVSALTFVGDLRPLGRRDWQLSAELVARVVQPCVATLAPVTTDIHEAVARRYLAEMPEPEAEETEMPEDDTVEQLPELRDVAEVMLEALALALPTYPRADGAAVAEFEARPDGAAPLSDTDQKPFSGLADLLKSAKGNED